MTVHAEILSRILALKDDATYLIRPKYLVEMALKYLAKRETRKNREKLKAVLLTS